VGRRELRVITGSSFGFADCGKGNFFDQLHGHIVHRLLGLLAERYNSLEPVDNRLRGVSPRDRSAFRVLVCSLPPDERHRVLDRLVAFTKAALSEVVDSLWSGYVHSNANDVEMRFNSSVLDYFRHLRELTGHQEVIGPNEYLGRLEVPDEFGVTSVLLVTWWATWPTDIVRRAIQHVEESRTKVVLVTGKGLDKPMVTTDIERVVSYGFICSEEAVHIFDSVGIAWLYI